MVDVGPFKDVAEAKIRGQFDIDLHFRVTLLIEPEEYLETYTRFPQTLRLFIGGGYPTN